MQRRFFLQLLPLLGAGTQVQAFSNARGQPENSKLCFFTKHLQWLDFDELAAVLAEADFDGADLTMRPGGHVEPEAAATDLPRARKALEARGLSLPMVVTRITDPNDPATGTLLEILADNGVSHYRMGYLRYEESTPPQAQLPAIHDRLARLAELNARYGLCANYQNHAGTNFGASIWDLAAALDGLDPQYVGCQFDIRHAVYEGGRSWRTDLRRIASHMTTYVVKDFHWIQRDNGNWHHRNVPLGKGMVPLTDFFELLGELGVGDVPTSLHAEYPLLSAAEEELPKPQRIRLAIERLRADVAAAKRAAIP